MIDEKIENGIKNFFSYVFYFLSLWQNIIIWKWWWFYTWCWRRWQDDLVPKRSIRFGSNGLIGRKIVLIRIECLSVAFQSLLVNSFRFSLFPCTYWYTFEKWIITPTGRKLIIFGQFRIDFSTLKTHIPYTFIRLRKRRNTYIWMKKRRNCVKSFLSCLTFLYEKYE